MRNGKKVIVIKIGSSTLVNEQGKSLIVHTSTALPLRFMLCVRWDGAPYCFQRRNCMRLGGLGHRRASDRYAFASGGGIGGAEPLMATYAEAFSRYDVLTSCVLITRHSTAQRNAYLHARDTLERLIDFDVVPIINENDTVSVEQIRFGDNDTLAALVSCLVQADMCVIFSDIEGLYTANPTIDPMATLIPLVERITPELMASAGGVTSKVGSGGMITKIRAARVLMLAGIPMVICHGRRQGSLIQLAHGESVGTYFVARNKAHDISPRKLWIALGDTAKGVLVVDDGAKRALVDTGSSLLSVGITSVEGSFFRGDIVDIKDQEGHLFARGRVNAPSSEVSLARGRSQKEIRGNELLVNLGDKPAVHRDELVVFE